MRNRSSRGTSWLFAVGAVVVLSLAGLAGPAFADNDLSLVSPFPEYNNELKNTTTPGANLDGTKSTTGVSFNGSVGPYTVPGSGTPAAVPSAGNIQLQSSSFGQAFSRDIPFANFTDIITDEARQLLFYEDAILANKNPLQTAFRFINLMYDVDSGGDPFSLIDIRIRLGSTSVGTTLTSLYNTTIDDSDGIVSEGELVLQAERQVREALRFAPLNEDLANTLLDIAYGRAVANSIFAKEYLVLAYQQSILPPPPGGFVVDNEIALMEQALALTRTATDSYYDLFQDRVGINTRALDPSATDNPPYGYWIFQKLVPRRPLNVSGFAPRNPGTTDPNTGEYTPGAPTGGTLLPLRDKNGNPLSTVVQGYKDWALLWDNLRDQMTIVSDLAKLYYIRGGVDADGELDIDKARELIAEARTRGLMNANVLLGIFPNYSPLSNDTSGIQASISGAYAAIAELDTTAQFIEAETNLLGFTDDFLMLVQNFVGTEDIFDSFDALVAFLNQLNSPLSASLEDFDAAVDSYDNYRGTVDQLSVEFDNQTTSYRDRLAQITGVDPGPDPRNPLDPRYLTPEVNEGSEIWLQLKSIEVARLQIEKNQVQISNLTQQVAIEVQRRADEAGINASIQDIVISYGDQQANLTEEIGAINAAQAAANEVAAACDAGFGAPPNIGGAVAHGVNAAVQAGLEVGKAFLEGDKEQLAAKEQAEIMAQEDALLDINSQANIKTWLLEMNTLAIESSEATLLLAQEVARLTALVDEKALIESRLLDSAADLVNRFFADPVHRLRFQSNMLSAQHAFQEAQDWVFFLARALEFKWNTPFVFNNRKGNWSIQSIFRSRNAQELKDVVEALVEFNGLLQGTSRGDDRFDWFSFTEDFLGYKKLDANGNEILYLDPDVGDLVPAKTIFKRYLKKNMDADGTLRLQFSTVRDKGTFFRGPRFDSNNNMVSPGLFLDKIVWMKINVVGTNMTPNTKAALKATNGGTRVAAKLSYGGTSFMRNPNPGFIPPDDPNTPENEARPDRIQDEMSAWSTRFFYFDPGKPFAKPPIPPRWRFKDAQQAVVTLNLSPRSEEPNTVALIDVFKERSVATSEWELVISTKEFGQTILNVDETDDIEILFYHVAKDRL